MVLIVADGGQGRNVCPCCDAGSTGDNDPASARERDTGERRAAKGHHLPDRG
jgi:hypothetical protein